MSEEKKKPVHFIKQIINDDLKSGKHNSIVTRFPPEPNGYLHIGHTKSIVLNFSLAEEYGGKCHLRFDDTNPEKESQEYIDSIKQDIQWLGFNWGENEYYASNYFQTLYEYAVHLIKEGKAYVDHLSAEEIRKYRGTLKEPGKNSPYRDRTVEENLELFDKMKNGEFKDGECVLRAKIDMASPNMVMRDPTIYRIKTVTHHRTGDKWCIYPMYDLTHCVSDALEHITHSLCTLEFEINRPLYDWVLDNVPAPSRPRQIEFARLNINYTVMSKRMLLQLVTEKLVNGWDDPRMPTVSGLRRRGYTPESIKNFIEMVGLSKSNSTVDFGMLEYAIREDLNKSAQRAMAVVNPIKLTIENYPEGKVEYIDAVNNPEDPEAGTRKVAFSRNIYIERDDFMENPPKKYFRLYPGNEVRLKYAYYVTCKEVIKDEDGNIKELICTYDPESKGGGTLDNRRVRGTLHWICADECVDGEVRLYDKLFSKENPYETEEGQTFLDNMNPDSLKVESCKLEMSLKDAKPEDKFQFERLGYFCADMKDHSGDNPVFNRTVTLKDTWKKMMQKQGK